jgi:hypothetical protein
VLVLVLVLGFVFWGIFLDRIFDREREIDDRV